MGLAWVELSPSFRKQSSNDMTFPHPQPRKDHDRDEDKSGTECVTWKLIKWAIDIAEYRNAEDEVNPAKNRTLGSFFHDEHMLLLIGDIESLTLVSFHSGIA
jgi:hypothetical protein